MCRKIALMCRNLLITCHKNIYFSKKMECFIDLFFLLTYNEKKHNARKDENNYENSMFRSNERWNRQNYNIL